MSRLDELRLMAKVARLYHEQKLRQAEITERLSMHQSTVSRILKRAEREGIVRVTLSMPTGLHTQLEDGLQSSLAYAKPLSWIRSTRKIRLSGISAPPRRSTWKRPCVRAR